MNKDESLSKVRALPAERGFLIRVLSTAVLLSFVAIGCRTVTSFNPATIHAAKSAELISWLDTNRVPKRLGNHDPEFSLAVCNELAARHEIDFLLQSVHNPQNANIRTLLISSVLYQIEDEKVLTAFRSLLSDTENEDSYYIANYLAKHGDPTAFATLNRHYFQYPVSSWQWSYTVELFGQYKYVPATTNLIESLDAASLNLSGAACHALQQIIPDSPKHFSGPTEARNYYLKKLNKAASEL